MQLLQVARMSNIAGGSLTLLSTLLPWMIEAQRVQFLFASSASAWVALILVGVGGLVSLRSRYGGLITTVGLLTYASLGRPSRFSIFPVEYSFGPGFWLARIGAPISLLGLSSTTDTLSLEPPMLNRSLIAPLGAILVAFGSFFLFAELAAQAPIQNSVAILLLPIIGFLAMLVGMTQGSVLVDRHPRLG